MLYVCILFVLATAVASQNVSACEGFYPDRYGRPCSGHGECIAITVGGVGEAVCVCDDDYAGDDCGDKRRPQILVFLMSFSLGGFGVDRYNMGLWQSATGKLALNLFLWVPACVIGTLGGMISGGLAAADGTVGSVFGALSGFASVAAAAAVILACFTWWIYDVVMFGMNRIHDSNGHGCAPW